MSIENFAVFILTHGRADNVKTYKSLRRCGYTGPIYLIIDNEDDQGDRYRELYGDEVIVFDKAKVHEESDAGDNFAGRRAILFARNVCFDIAEDLGVEYFLELDDDYDVFKYMFNGEADFQHLPIKDLDKVFQLTLDYFESIDADCIAWGQGGDYIGGPHGTYAKTIRTKRKIMNTFFLSTRRRFDFLARLNEDVNSYLYYGRRGRLVFTLLQLAISQADTQAQAGGADGIISRSRNVSKIVLFSFVRPVVRQDCANRYESKEDTPRDHMAQCHADDYQRTVQKTVP